MSHHPHPLLRLGTLACVVITLALMPLRAAHALSFDAALDSMFYRASTDPGPYNSQRRSGYVAGSMSFRAPVRTYNILAFDPPRIRAGCSGLDLFGGSFSFINSEQLKLLIKQIGSAALGYAVYIAINEMCKPCGATLSFLQKLMTELNSMNVNSCKVAKGLVDSVLKNDHSAIKELVTQRDGMIARIQGYFSDWTKEMAEGFTNPEKPSKYADIDPVTGATSTNPNNPMKGNLVWRALWRDRVTNAIGDPDSAAAPVLDVEMAQYIMSITGTYVVPMVGATTGCPDTTGSGTPTNPYPKECLPHRYEPLLSFNELLHGTGGEAVANYPNKLEYWRCTDATNSATGCQRLAKTQFRFAGTLGYVHKRFFGYHNIYRSDLGGGGIIDKIAAGTALNADEAAFIQTLPFPLYGMLMKLQRNPPAMAYFALLAEKPIAEMLVVTLGQTLIRVANQVFSGHSDVAPPPDWNERVAQIEAALQPYVARGPDQIKVLNELAKGAEVMVTSFPQPTLTVSKAK